MAIRSEAHDHRSETTATPIWNPLPRRSKTTATQSRSWERILTVKGREERAWDRKEKRLRGIWKVRGRERVWEIKNQFFFTNSWTVLSLQPRKEQNCKRIHVRFSKFFVNYTQKKKKNLLFLFYIATFINHLRQFIYFTIYFNKIFILSLFFLLFLTNFKTYARSPSFITHFTDHLSLSLSHKNYRVSLSFSFFTGSFLYRLIQILSSPVNPRTKLQRPRSFLHRPIHEPSSPTQITSSPADPRTKLWRLRSFLHQSIQEPSSPPQITSSLADPRTKLHDPDPFFTDRSTNQTPQAPIYLSVGLSVWVCLCVSLFLCWFVCVDVFVCIWRKEDEELRSLNTEKREKNWCEWKLIK